MTRTREEATEGRWCLVPDCMEDFYAKGRCKRHYYRNKRGVPEDGGRQHAKFKYNASGQRWCNYHQLHHEVKDFGDNIESVDGLKGDCREACKLKNRLWRYGISEEDFKDRLEKQNGLCALCQENEATHVDHDHKCCDNPTRKSCGKCNRDILCGPCNAMLGNLEREGWLDKAMKYMKKHGGKKA